MATNDEELKALGSGEPRGRAGARSPEASRTDRKGRREALTTGNRLGRANCVRWLASSSLQLSSWRHCTCATAWQTAIRRLQSRLRSPKLASVPQRMRREGSSISDQAKTDSTPAKCTCPGLSHSALIHREHGWRKQNWRPHSWIDQWELGQGSVPPIEYKQVQVSTAASRLPVVCRANAPGRVQTGEGGDGSGYSR